MDFSLDDDIYSNDITYFFSLHGPRFESMNQAMAISLSTKFGKEFRAIRILNAWPSKQYDYGNYIVLNKQSYKLAKQLKKPVVYLPDYEDVNVEFCENEFIREIADRLMQKQDKIYVYPFTTSFLELPNESFTLLGPDSALAAHFDSKVNQLKLFTELGLPCNNAVIYETEQELLEQAAAIVPCYLSASYTSGGNESGLIYTVEMLREFLNRIRPINKKNSFVVSDIFEDIVLAPNVNALITNEGKVYVLVLSDQILQGNRYLGNTYPSIASEFHQQQMFAITTTVGDYLVSQGYRGLFGLDFLINRAGDLVVVDLNPRHQGGYAVNGLSLHTKDISLTDIELAIYNDEKVVLSQDKLDKYLEFAWAHSKLLPAEKGQTVKAEYHKGSIQEPFTDIGATFVTEFYEERSVFIEGYIGYQVVTAKERGELEPKLLHAKEQFDAKVLGL